MEAARPVTDFIERLDARITMAARQIHRRSFLFDASMTVIAKWTPTTMLLLVLLATSGLFLTTGPSLLPGFSAVVAAVLARLINEPISRWFARLRPFELDLFIPLLSHEGGQAFPSNHATGAFALAISMYTVPAYGPVMLCLAVFLCLSRVYTGVHHLTDVIGGALNGSLVACLLHAAVLFIFA